MIALLLEVVTKFAALGRSVAFPVLLAGFVAIPIAIWQITFFQIESTGEGRALILVSFVVSLLIVYPAMVLTKWIKKKLSRRDGLPNEDSPWNDDK